MKLASLLTALAISAGLLTAASPAQARRPIRDRLNRQERRIQEGVATGELTPGEADRLQSRLNQDARHFRHARRGGLSGSARDRIQDDLDRNSDRIKHDRSNRNYRYNGRYRYNRSYSPYYGW